jgi:hypothetical protein
VSNIRGQISPLNEGFLFSHFKMHHYPILQDLAADLCPRCKKGEEVIIEEHHEPYHLENADIHNVKFCRAPRLVRNIRALQSLQRHTA